MNFSVFISLSGIFVAVAACTGPAPTIIIRKTPTEAQVGSVSSGKNQKSDSEATADVGSKSVDGDGENNGGNNNAENNGGNNNGENNGGNNVAENNGENNGGNKVTVLPPVGNQDPLAWLPVGDFPLSSAQMKGVNECANATNIIRSACQSKNSLCRSSFAVTCDSSTDCRRLFKCTTGQTGALIWFPMGNDVKKSAQVSNICPINSNIAGAACQTVNDRCLSSFCTSGSGDDCGRRLFKCMTSGEPGRLFWRWVEDKSSAELAAAGIATCQLDKNVAGASCSGMNSLCQSSFCAQGEAPNCTKRRLFKCTP